MKTKDTAGEIRAMETLPELIGTKRQVTSAQKVRQQFMLLFEIVVAEITRPGGAASSRKMKVALGKLRTRLCQATSAEWWVNRRPACESKWDMGLWCGRHIAVVDDEYYWIRTKG